MDTVAIKTKTAATKGQTDNKPFHIFRCLRALVLVKAVVPTAAPRRPRHPHCSLHKKGLQLARATGMARRHPRRSTGCCTAANNLILKADKELHSIMEEVALFKTAQIRETSKSKDRA